MKNNIKKLRASRGITQKRFAELLGTSQRRVSLWETADSLYNLRLGNIIAICNALNCTIDELIEGE